MCRVNTPFVPNLDSFCREGSSNCKHPIDQVGEYAEDVTLEAQA